MLYMITLVLMKNTYDDSYIVKKILIMKIKVE